MNFYRDMRNSLLQIFNTAVAAVAGRNAVATAMRRHPMGQKLALLAIGKAAADMAQGARDVLGDQIEIGLVITKHGHGDPALPYETIESGHPTPDEASLRAGQRLLEFIRELPPEMELLVLISGGTSALVEVLPPGMGLEQLQRATDWLLGSGMDIHQMNRVRKGLSMLKGGRLAQQLQGRRVVQLLISDVPGDDMAAIGSGPLVASDGGPLDTAALPAWLQECLQQVPPGPAAGDPCFDNIESEIVASNALALDAAQRKAEELGLEILRHPEPISGAAEAMAATVVAAMEQQPGLHLWGGESTVVLPERPGRGGRNQHLALYAAKLLAGREESWVLAAGTDGSDGVSADAGALVDGATLARGDLHYPGGSRQALREFNAGVYLEGSGDLIRTGPTGTNVMDVILAYRRM